MHCPRATSRTGLLAMPGPEAFRREEDVDRIIHQSAHLRCDVHRAFELFTVNEDVQSWLASLADIEPHEGGKYELFWDVENREENSTLGCKVTAIEGDRFLSFEWRGPTQYLHFMNDADPLTHVVVFLIPSSDGSGPCTEVHVVHTGWRSSPEWEEARQWFVKAWRVTFEELERQASAT